MQQQTLPRVIGTENSRALIVEVPLLPYSILAHLYPTGSRADPPDLYGLTHAVEHLAGPSSTATSAWREYTETLERHGILFEAYTTKDYTVFSTTQPSESTDVAHALLGKLSFTYDLPRLHTELLAIHEEGAEEETDVGQTMAHAVACALWPHSTIAHPIIGNKETLASIDESAVRTHIERYFTSSHRKTLTLTKSLHDETHVFSDVHGLETSACMDVVEEFKERVPFSIDDSLSLGERVRVGIYFRTVPAYARNDRMFLALFAHHLAGFWTSLLNQALRVETGASYWVTSEPAYYHDTGSLGFEFTCSIERVTDVLKVAMTTIDVSCEGIAHERFEALKRARRAEIIRESMDRCVLKEWYIEELAYHANPITLDSYLSKLSTLDYEHFIATVRRFITKERRSVVILGDVHDVVAKQLESITNG